MTDGQLRSELCATRHKGLASKLRPARARFGGLETFAAHQDADLGNTEQRRIRRRRLQHEQLRLPTLGRDDRLLHFRALADAIRDAIWASVEGYGAPDNGVGLLGASVLREGQHVDELRAGPVQDREATEGQAGRSLVDRPCADEDLTPCTLVDLDPFAEQLCAGAMILGCARRTLKGRGRLKFEFGDLFDVLRDPRRDHHQSLEKGVPGAGFTV